MGWSIIIKAPNLEVRYDESEIPHPVKDRKEFDKWCRTRLRDEVERAIVYSAHEGSGMKQQKEYPFIKLWGKRLGSSQSYIGRQLERAKETNAPEDALFEEYDSEGKTGKWCTLAELKDTNLEAYEELSKQAIEIFNTGIERR